MDNMVVLLISIITLLLSLCIYISNFRLKRKIDAYKFHLLDDEVRNYDILVIGDEYNADKLDNKLVYRNCLRYRSLYSSFLILKERFSLLREDGKGIVYIPVKRKYLYGISPIDYINFHQITCKRLRCNPGRIRKRIPIISFVTWEIGQILTFRKPSQSEWDKLVDEMHLFCNERNININIIEL